VSRISAWAWAALGALLGALIALPVFAPASWLAATVARGTGDRLLLTEARGPWWRGDAQVLLSGGAGSRDAALLPGRMHWHLVWEAGPVLRVQQACCIDAPLRLRLRPSWSGLGLELLPASSSASQWLAQWPAAWLTGLGTPWNTLQLGGTLRLASPGFSALPAGGGRWQLGGATSIELDGLSSRLSTLDPLGSYRLNIRAGATPSEPAVLELQTLRGSLLLEGQGQFTAQGLRFRGQARAAEGTEAVLNNLLNLIGRRQGPLAVIAIG
jgi:general secretion pathway protein N